MAQTLWVGSDGGLLDELRVAAVVVLCKSRADVAGRYDRQTLGNQHYFYKRPSRDEGSGKYLLRTFTNGSGWKIGTKLSASSGGLARCSARNLFAAAEAEWMVKTSQGALRLDRSLKLKLLQQEEVMALTLQLRNAQSREVDLTTQAVREVFQSLGPDESGRVLIANAVGSDVLKGEHRLLELLQALEGDSLDYEDFECAYLQCKDRYEIRVAHLVGAFAKFCGGDVSRGLAVTDAARFAEQVLNGCPQAQDIDWRNAFKNRRIDLDEFMEVAASPADWLVYRFSQIVGLSGLKEDIRRFHRGVLIDERRRFARPNFHSQQRLHMIFRGNPGTGKTRIAELMGRLLFKAGLIKNSGVLEVQRDSLVASHVGETAIKTQAVIDKAKQHYGILFVDEAYRLHMPDSSRDFGREAIEQLMASMLDPEGPTMILAGYRKEMDGFLTANPGLRSRINYTFDFDNYDARELAQIFRMTAARNCFSVEPDDELVASVLQRHAPPGAAEQMNGRMCEIVFEFAKQALDMQLDPEGDVSFELAAEHIEYGCKRVPRPPQSFIREALDEEDEIEDNEEWLNAQLERIVGMQAVKQEILNLFYTTRIDDLRRQLQMVARADFSAHMIFTGPPGVGKTTVARLVALLLHRMGVLPSRKCVEVQREQLVTGPEALSRVLEQAHGGVLFVDEAYRLAAGGEDWRGREALEQLMAAMLSPPPAPLMVFAGYDKEMNDFLATNPGIESRISYRFNLVAYDPEDLARILALYIGGQGFRLQLHDRLAGGQEDIEAIKELGSLISQHTTQETREVYNGRLCQHVFYSAKRSLDRRTSAAIRDSGLAAADARDIERRGLITNTLLLDDLVDGLRLLEAKARASRPATAPVQGSPPRPPAARGGGDASPARPRAPPPRGVPVQTVVIDAGTVAALQCTPGTIRSLP